MNYQPHLQTEKTCPTMYTGAMISGIIGLLLCMLPVFGLVAPALAIIFAVLGRGNQFKITGQGLAGLIMGIIGIVGNIVFFIFLMVLFVLMNTSGSLMDF